MLNNSLSSREKLLKLKSKFNSQKLSELIEELNNKQ